MKSKAQTAIIGSHDKGTEPWLLTAFFFAVAEAVALTICYQALQSPKGGSWYSLALPLFVLFLGVDVFRSWRANTKPTGKGPDDVSTGLVGVARIGIAAFTLFIYTVMVLEHLH